MVRRVRNILKLFKYWKALQMAYTAVNDPHSKKGKRLLEDVTLEELNGITDLEVVYRILTLPPRELEKELKHLHTSLTKTN